MIGAVAGAILLAGCVRVTLARLHDWFLDASRREARAGARLIVWPEQNLLVFRDDEPAFLERATRLAAEEHIYLAMGMGTVYLGDPLPFENKLVLIGPSGELLAAHTKTRPVAGWEAGIMKRGTAGIPVVETRDGRVAGAICFEGDFPEVIRTAGVNLADLLILPVSDLFAWLCVAGLVGVFGTAIVRPYAQTRRHASNVSADRRARDGWGADAMASARPELVDARSGRDDAVRQGAWTGR